MERFKRAYAAFEDFLAGGLLFIGLTLIFVNVILRYFFGRPMSLLDEFSVYFVVWGTLIGTAVALRNNHHIKVDMVYNFLPIKLKRIVSIFANSLGLAFCAFYTYFGYQLVQNYIVLGQRSADSQFPLWIVNLVMPLSGLMFGLRFVEKLVFLFKKGGKEWIEEEMRRGDDNGNHLAI